MGRDGQAYQKNYTTSGDPSSDFENPTSDAGLGEDPDEICEGRHANKGNKHSDCIDFCESAYCDPIAAGGGKGPENCGKHEWMIFWKSGQSDHNDEVINPESTAVGKIDCHTDHSQDKSPPWATDWAPNHKKFHCYKKEISSAEKPEDCEKHAKCNFPGCGNSQGAQCWELIEDYFVSAGWKLNQFNYFYDMDAPVHWNEYGKIGCNCVGSCNHNPHSGPDQQCEVFSSQSEVKHPVNGTNFKYYYVPSVPVLYACGAGFTATWDWTPEGSQDPHPNNHTFKHKKCMYCCKKAPCCGPWPPTCNNGAPYGSCCQGCHHTACCFDGTHPLTNLTIEPKEAVMNWAGHGGPGQGQLFEDIQKPELAGFANHNGQDWYDDRGVSGQLCGDKGVQWTLNGQSTSFGRYLVRVKDVTKPQHVEFGRAGENEKFCVLFGSTGERITEYNEMGGQDNKGPGKGSNPDALQIRLIDNAANCTPAYFADPDPTLPCRKDPKVFNENFRMIFWYEVPVYDYMSYTDSSLGFDTTEVAYCPRFVWKRGLSLHELTGDGGIKSFYGGNRAPLNGTPSCSKRGYSTIDPEYVVYEAIFSLQELFNPEEGSACEEERMGWHYAKTPDSKASSVIGCLGDEFGNPPWSPKMLADSPFNTTLNSRFPVMPLKFKTGHGALKIAVEFIDCSGNMNFKFCGNDNYFGEPYPKDCEHTKDYNQTANNFLEHYWRPDDYCQEQVPIPVANEEFEAEDNNPTLKIEKSIKSGGKWRPGEEVDNRKFGNELMTDQHLLSHESDPNVSWYKNYSSLGQELISYGQVKEFYQTFGRVVVEDNDRPNVGLMIYNKMDQSYRFITQYNGDDMREPYRELKEREDRCPTGSNNYDDKAHIVNETVVYISERSKKTPSHRDKLGVFCGEAVSALPIWEWGKDGMPESYKGLDSPWGDVRWDGYGLPEDIALVMSHQDLKQVVPSRTFNNFYAYDNIDGLRVQPEGGPRIELFKKHFYKGLQTVKQETFAHDNIRKGYATWEIFDETYSKDGLERFYMDAEKCHFLYPEITFHNPNKKGDGSDLAGKKDIGVRYKVVDESGNEREFILHFFTTPTGVEIQRLERKEKRTDFIPPEE